LSNTASHQKTEKHHINTNAIDCSGPLPFAPNAKRTRSDDDLKKAEINMAVTAACHFPVQAMDHSHEVIVRNARGRSAGKCSLAEGMKGQKYSFYLHR